MTSSLLFIMLDGCRPDALMQASTPRLDSLWQTGAYTWKARSVMPSVTLPAHSSIFRGVTPQQHGIRDDNVYRPSAAAFPSLFDLAAEAGKHNAIFYSWEQLRDLAAPGSMKMSYCKAAEFGKDNDTHIAETCADYLVSQKPDLCFLYLGDIDISGHVYTWMSPEYIRAIEANDKAVGIVLDKLGAAGLRDQYTILVQADHGGHDYGHGSDSPEDMTIPWIINGPAVKRGYELHSSVGLCDSAATMAHVLGVKQPDIWEGKPVLEAFE